MINQCMAMTTSKKQHEMESNHRPEGYEPSTLTTAPSCLCSQLLDRKKCCSPHITSQVLANSFFGVGNSQNASFVALPPIVESTTQLGRRALEKTKNGLVKRYGDFAAPVYGDTDSLFLTVKIPEKDKMTLPEVLATSFKLGDIMSDWVTNTLFADVHSIQIKIDEVMWPFISLNVKKSYVGNCYEDPDRPPHRLLKGLEAKRRNTPQFVKDVTRELLDCVMPLGEKPRPISEISAQCLRIVESYAESILSDMPVDKFQLSGTLKEDYSKSKILPAHAAVAKRLRVAIENGSIGGRAPPTAGSRQAYVISTLESKKIADRAFDPEMLSQSKYKLDRAYYLTGWFANSVRKLTSFLPPAEYEQICNIVSENSPAAKHWLSRSRGFMDITMMFGGNTPSVRSKPPASRKRKSKGLGKGSEAKKQMRLPF